MDIHLAQPLQAVQGLFKAAGCPTNSAGFDIATHFEEMLGSKLGQQVNVICLLAP